MNEENKQSVSLEVLRGLDEQLLKNILGQGRVLPVIISAVIRSELGLEKLAPRLLFLGPTGTGKTETAIQLSQILWGCPPLRIDMSELDRADALEMLLGNRSGDPGLLGAIPAEGGRGLILFDEIEKAPPRVLNLFLQILEPGYVTLASGKRVDLRRFIIVATSNIASAEIVEVLESSPETIERHVLNQVRERLRPEILNRFHETVVFLPLEYDTILAIADLHLQRHLAFLNRRGHRVLVTPRVGTFLVRHGFDRTFGARPMRRAVERFVGNAVANDILSGGDGCGWLVVDTTETFLVLQRSPEPAEACCCS